MADSRPEVVQSREDLGRELSALRVQAGLSVRELARRVGSPAATLGDYFAGRHLPGPAQAKL
ncbi:MAG: helix-turn-helix domain-containing protein, partial [Acidimicrobiales bacterium]